MSEEQKLDDFMEVLDEQEKKPYETAVVGIGQFGSDGGGIEISVNGVVHDCFYANGADEITFSDKARVIREGAVASVGDIHDIGFYCGTLRIPANIEEIEPGAFSSLESVDQVVVDPENPNYKVIDDVIFTKDGKTLIYCPANKRGAYEVPEGTEKIVHMAFYYGGVNSITIPESVTEIEFLAFFESDLEEIRGVAGSYAEEYADKEGLLFVDVDEEEDDEDDDKDGESVVSHRLDVVLVAPGTDRLAVIKLLKNELGMGVADAKAVIDSAPTVIKQGLVSHLAKDLVSKFTAVGAKMKVQ